MPGGIRSDPLFAAIATSTTNTTLVAAVAGRKVRVMGFAIGASGGANSVSLESTAGGTQLMGVVNLAANGQLVLPYAEAGWCEATAGQLLNLKLSAATAVGGTLIYVLVDG